MPKSKSKRSPRDQRRRRPTDSSPKASSAVLPESDPGKKPFVPANLDRTVIATPLLSTLNAEVAQGAKPRAHPVIIDLNLDFPGGRQQAARWAEGKIGDLLRRHKRPSDKEGLRKKEVPNQQYLFASLTGDVIRELVRDDNDPKESSKRKILSEGHFARAIYHIWPDFKIKPLITRSISTVKADAAHAAFSAFGESVVWAVLDSGIDVRHPHFKLHRNLDLKPPLAHLDFTGENVVDADPFGHGTHVAGIIAGEGQQPAAGKAKKNGLKAYVRERDETGQIAYRELALSKICGMAPRCKLVNMRVLDGNGEGEASNIIAALSRIQEINGYGRRLLIHGVNISVGNDFEPEWFACGQSPLCVEVDRLVNSGVVVVVAAGNSGYGSLETAHTGVVSAGMSLTINDPGNAEQAITVGATHRDMPHVYGVSYFSSKGPTGDGRLKPDLIAPGEKIVSCAAGAARAKIRDEAGQDCDYYEDSGTSMAAPHVSGVIAAFLSSRREFIGQPGRVKQIFLSTATDLKREKYFQGAGLIDLMRAIQSI